MSLADEARRLMRTAGYSLDGWRYAWRQEKSLRQWVGVNAASALALLVLRPPLWACALLIVLGLGLLVMELLNSAIEATIDHISTDRHPLAKAAKDAASAAVAVTGLAFVAAWVFALLALF